MTSGDECYAPGPGFGSGAIRRIVSISDRMGGVVGTRSIAEAEGLCQHVGDRTEQGD